MTPLGSIPVSVVSHMCQRPVLGFGRRHRKRRLAKKLSKLRRGRPVVILGRCSGHAVNFGGRIMCCPCVAAAIKAKIGGGG